MEKPNCSLFITYKINETVVKIFSQSTIAALTKANINYELRCSRDFSQILSTIIDDNKVPVSIQPEIFMTGLGYKLEENEFWLTLDELRKQKQHVVNLVNRHKYKCISVGLKKSITKRYENPGAGFVCIHGANRGNRIQHYATLKEQLSRDSDFHPHKVRSEVSFRCCHTSFEIFCDRNQKKSKYSRKTFDALVNTGTILLNAL